MAHIEGMVANYNLRVVVSFLPLVLFCCIIFALSQMSHPPIPQFMEFTWGDKILHMTAYSAVGFAAAWQYYYLHGVLDRRAVTRALLISALYGVSDEIHQLFVPDRDFEFLDMVADILGASLGIWALYLVLKLKKA